MPPEDTDWELYRKATARMVNRWSLPSHPDLDPDDLIQDILIKSASILSSGSVRDPMAILSHNATNVLIDAIRKRNRRMRKEAEMPREGLHEPSRGAEAVERDAILDAYRLAESDVNALVSHRERQYLRAALQLEHAGLKTHDLLLAVSRQLGWSINKTYQVRRVLRDRGLV